MYEIFPQPCIKNASLEELLNAIHKQCSLSNKIIPLGKHREKNQKIFQTPL